MIIHKCICGIYKITNKINGKYYIGQSKNIQLNWLIHTLNYINKEEHPLYNEMQKYGIQNFDFSILETTTINQLQKRFDYYKNLFNIYEIDYNQFEPPYLKNDEKILQDNIEIINYENIDKLIPPLTLEFNKLKNEFIIHSQSNKKHKQIEITKISNEICGIYKIENKLNGKKYIGQSKNIYNRWNEHKQQINNKYNQAPLYKAIRYFGLYNFKFEILEECKIEELNEKEKYYIKKYNSIKPNGYNIMPGGEYIRK